MAVCHKDFGSSQMVQPFMEFLRFAAKVRCLQKKNLPKILLANGGGLKTVMVESVNKSP